MATQSSSSNTKQAHRQNIIALKIPGLTDKVKVEFPTRRLPSCEKCKRQFKTRELCRSQKRHETLPCTTVNICITLNPACLDKDNNIVSDVFSSRTIGWQPYKFKEGAVDVKMLMCADCKNKNYTRSSCRGREKYGHRHLPWNTVYCEFSPLPCDTSKKSNNELSSSATDDAKKNTTKTEVLALPSSDTNKKSSNEKLSSGDNSKKTIEVNREKDEEEDKKSSDKSSLVEKEKAEEKKCSDEGNNLEESKRSPQPSSNEVTKSTKESYKNKKREEMSSNSEGAKADDSIRSPPKKKTKECVNDDHGYLPPSVDTGLVDFKKVEKSRTFFLEVSGKSLKMQWLELDEGITSSPRYGARFNVHQDFNRQHPTITSSEADHHWYPQANFYPPPQMMGFNPYHHFHQMYGLQQQLRQQAGPFSNFGFNAEPMMQNTPPQILPGMQNPNQNNPSNEEWEAQVQMQRHYPV